ncbi:MAG: cyclopropane fatty-acyl-phospholipid synthase-like methyltransferase [Shewanella sp.]
MIRLDYFVTSLPYSQSCENNKAAIAAILEDAFSLSTHVLEIGSGTGQHAVHFAKLLPHLTWQTSDQLEYHAGINAWLNESSSTNLRQPLVLDVLELWPVAPVTAPRIDAIFTANTLHIMSKEMVSAFFHGVGQHLSVHGQLCVYGPFNYQGQYSSDSNRNFDCWLAAQNPQSAIRDFEWIVQLAAEQGLTLIADFSMPANNRLLHFEKRR